MTKGLFLVLSISAIIIMVYGLVKAISLSKKIPAGGTVGSAWRFLSSLIALFTAGYFTTPFFPLLSDALKQLIVGVIFLAGAVFVVIVINLFYKIVKEIGL